MDYQITCTSSKLNLGELRFLARYTDAMSWHMGCKIHINGADYRFNLNRRLDNAAEDVEAVATAQQFISIDLLMGHMAEVCVYEAMLQKGVPAGEQEETVIEQFRQNISLVKERFIRAHGRTMATGIEESIRLQLN